MEKIIEELEAIIRKDNKIDDLFKECQEDVIPMYLKYSSDIISKLYEFMKHCEQTLISVKQQKTLKTCFQLITSLGLLPCLLPGLGVALEKRSEYGSILAPIKIDDLKKYEYLKKVVDFFIEAYNVPILKNIIMTHHLSDYLAGLIQLSFAPLKKPGVYGDFNMTEDLYKQFSGDRKKYTQVYGHLVVNSFQPTLMKELLLLQSMQNPAPPKFATRIISKELSNRLLASGGLLSLMRCFIESYKLDIGTEWKQIEMLCKIVTTIQGHLSEDEYLKNICEQLKEILYSNNVHYVTVSSACLQSLKSKYPQNAYVQQLCDVVLQAFDCSHIQNISIMPGTVIYSANEIENKINVLHACFISNKIGMESKNLNGNLYFLFCLRNKLGENDGIYKKITNLLLKYLEETDDIESSLNMMLYNENSPILNVCFVEIDSKIILKCSCEPYQPNILENATAILNLLKETTSSNFLLHSFTFFLKKISILSSKKSHCDNRDLLLLEDDAEIFNDYEQKYASTLQLLEELCSMPAVLSSLTKSPSILFGLIKTLLANDADKASESISIALVLLNTLLESYDSTEFCNEMDDLYHLLGSFVKTDKNSSNHLLATEALAILNGKKKTKVKSKCDLALDDVMDKMLPVRAHGIMQLTKLIEAKDLEAISKKHYLFCIFQQHLKDDDSYIYLASVNGLAALGKHCTDDVLQVLCKEYLEISTESIEVRESTEKRSEFRMKVGDVIVKITNGLGEIAVTYKTLLLNTMLCACRDEDPLIRTSALSNLAEIARVIGYRVGTIIHEILVCIWSTIDSEKSPECRRAAVMVIAGFLKGMDKTTLIQFKDVLLPIYRSLKALYSNEDEDYTVRLHAQLALEELNETVNQFLFPEIAMENKVFVL